MYTEYEVKNFEPGMKVYLLRVRSGSTKGSEPKEYTVQKVGRKYITIDKDLVLPFPGEDMLQSIKKDKKTSEGRVLCGKGRRLWKNI